MKTYAIAMLLILSYTTLKSQVNITKNVDYIKEVVYENDKDFLDIYMPEGQTNVPVIVYFHGGALLNGNKDGGNNIGLQLAKSGIGFVSANYRLSPNVQHPSHVKDAASATAWVIKNIKKYGGDPNQVYVSGHSAGAYLAALLAIDSSLLEVHTINNSDLGGAVLISPFLFVEETAKDRVAEDPINETIWGTNSKAWLQASVSPHLETKRDNILLIYADGDDTWRKNQNNRFASAMTKAGNQRIITKEVPNRNHSSLLEEILKDDDEIIDLIINFILEK